MMHKILLVAALSLAVAACGTSRSTRAITGGAAGAGAGALAGELISGSPATGALVGGALGAAAGGLTDCSQLGSCDSPFD